MRLRKPIICGHHTSVPEIAGSAALYVNVKDPVELASAMKRISEDRELRASLVYAGEHRLGGIQHFKRDPKVSRDPADR
jgi:hypothetical protein